MCWCAGCTHTQGESADPGGHDLSSDPSSVAAELRPGQHTHILSGRENMDTHTHTHRHTCTQPLSTHTYTPPINTHTQIPALWPLSSDLGQHKRTRTIWQGEHGLSPCLPNPGISGGHVRAHGYVAWSSVGQGRPAAGLGAPPRGVGVRGGAARGWERSWSGNGSKQSHLPPGRWNF